MEEGIGINFISLVTLGRFNPAILTPHFLSDTCGFSSTVGPEGQTSPVVSQISFANLQFYVDLNKFQIRLDNPKSLSRPEFIDIGTRYLQVLGYTPLDRMGVNINADLVVKNAEEFSTSEPLVEFKRISPRLARTVLFSTTMGFGDDYRPILVGCDIRWYWGENQTLRLELNRKETNAFVGNLNFEVAGLDNDRTRIDQIDKNFSEFSALFPAICKHLAERG